MAKDVNLSGTAVETVIARTSMTATEAAVVTRNAFNKRGMEGTVNGSTVTGSFHATFAFKGTYIVEISQRPGGVVLDGSFKVRGNAWYYVLMALVVCVGSALLLFVIGICILILGMPILFMLPRAAERSSKASFQQAIENVRQELEWNTVA